MPKILVIEDDSTTLLLLKRDLQLAGYEVAVAKNGKEGINQAFSFRPAVIICDWMMPIMDGLQVCRTVKSTPELASTFFILVTSRGEVADRVEGLDAGADDFLSKPIEPIELMARVRSALRLYGVVEKEKELNQLKSRFISIASHELRIPLATILTSSDLLKNYSHKLSDEKKAEQLDKIQKQVKRMTNLLDDVLLIGKSEAGKIEFESQLINLEVFCQEIIEEIELADQKNHNFILDFQGNNALIEVDEKLLRNILINLLSNAAKYSPQGRSVYLKILCQDGETMFEVQDQGIGIPTSDQPTLFEAFKRASNVGNIAGTGLGLAIIKQAVDLHGGTITFKTQVDVGTTFCVSIPTRQSKNES